MALRTNECAGWVDRLTSMEAERRHETQGFVRVERYWKLEKELEDANLQLNEATELARHYTGTLWPPEVNRAAEVILRVLEVRASYERGRKLKTKGEG